MNTDLELRDQFRAELGLEPFKNDRSLNAYVIWLENKVLGHNTINGAFNPFKHSIDYYSLRGEVKTLGRHRAVNPNSSYVNQ